MPREMPWKCQGKKYPALKKMSLMAYNAWKKKSYTGNMMRKKILYPEVWEKKIVTQTKSPITLPPQ